MGAPTEGLLSRWSVVIAGENGGGKGGGWGRERRGRGGGKKEREREREREEGKEERTGPMLLLSDWKTNRLHAEGRCLIQT